MDLLRKLPDIIDSSRKLYEEAVAGSFSVSEEVRPMQQTFLNESTGGNILAHGDNLAFMKYLLENREMAGKLNLIYVDPPFFTQGRHEAVVTLPGSGETVKVPAYTDKWEKDTYDYFTMLCIRLYGMKELLAEDGCIWMHLDWHMVHYVKAIMDEIFGYENFVNEVIWTYKSGGSSKSHFSRKHDTLLFYGKSNKYCFYPQKEKSYNRGFKPYRFKGVEEFEDEIGWYTMVNMKDVWQIDMVGRTSSERTGYATQKPVALLDRIIESCTKPGDICADFFGGSGTLAASATGKGRKWIYCDGGDLATAMCRKRMQSMEESFVLMDSAESEQETRFEEGFDIDRLRVNIVNKKDTKKMILNIEDCIKLVDNITDDGRSAVLLDHWSIDLDYDGSVHRASEYFFSGEGIPELEFVKEVEEFKNISLCFVDIFGHREYLAVYLEGNN